MREKKSQPHGMAAMLVLVVVAIATLIGMAMLSSASLQASVADSAARGAVADYLAGSAIQAAAHYLQYPAKQPATWTKSGYALYVTGAAISGVSGSFDVNAKLDSSGAPDVYDVNATAYSGSGNTVTRSVTAQVQLQRAMPANAGAFGTGSFSVSNGYTFNGSILSGGPVTVAPNAVVTGSVSQSSKSTDFVLPTTTTINTYGAGSSSYTMPDGSICFAQPVNALLGTFVSLPTPNANNPGKIFYINGPLTISPLSSLTLNGTLIVLNSNTLTIKNGNPLGNAQVSVTITPQSGFPAIITTQDLTVSKNTSLIANGVVWVGRKIIFSGANASTSMVVNGSLLVPTGTGLGALGAGSATINYTSANATVNYLNTTPEPIVGIKYLSASQ